MDKHTKNCVFRPSRCEYCGAETTFNRLQVSWHTHPYSEWVTGGGTEGQMRGQMGGQGGGGGGQGGTEGQMRGQMGGLYVCVT